MASGTSYQFTLTNVSQCANYYDVNGDGITVTINGVAYGVADCSNVSGPVILELTWLGNGTAVVLASSAPVTFNGGGTTGATGCMYNSSGNPIALPIELLYFKGTPSVSRNVLAWETVREVSSRGFEVQRMLPDGGWQTLSFVKSQGAYGTYKFADNNPLSTSYYRLNQLDNDGKNTYSPVITLATGSSGKDKPLRVYPNPVSNVLTVESDKTDDFHIVNLLGQQVWSGKNTGRIDVSALPQGAYFVKVGTEQVKFIKQ